MRKLAGEERKEKERMLNTKFRRGGYLWVWGGKAMALGRYGGLQALPSILSPRLGLGT